MKNGGEITGIVKSVKNGDIIETATNVVPTIKDILSARIMLNEFSSMEDFSHRFKNTFLWLKELQEKENWKLIFQDFLFLTWLQQ